MPIATTQRDYKGHVIEFGAYESKTPGQWFGVFRIHKDGTKIHGADIVSPLDTPTLAESNAMEKAKEYVNGLAVK